MLHIPHMNLHPMQTHNKNGIVKKKVCLVSATASPPADVSLLEPSSYKAGMKIPVWMQAMQEEIDALQSQNTWSLVSLPSHKNLVGV